MTRDTLDQMDEETRISNLMMVLQQVDRIVTDAEDHREEVRGLAVVGHQPVLKPDEQFEYTSWTRIATPHGTMRGTFFCMTEYAYP